MLLFARIMAPPLPPNSPTLSPVQAQVVLARARGAAVTAAASAAGLHRSTIHNWLHSQKEFDKAVQEARTEYFLTLRDELRDLSRIALASDSEARRSARNPPHSQSRLPPAPPFDKIRHNSTRLPPRAPVRARAPQARNRDGTTPAPAARPEIQALLFGKSRARRPEIGVHVADLARLSYRIQQVPILVREGDDGRIRLARSRIGEKP